MTPAGRLLATAMLLPALLLGQDPLPGADGDPPRVPSGLGQLGQDEITLRLRSGPLEIRLVPLDERVTRLLSPDSERALLALLESRRAVVDSLAGRHAVRRVGVVLVTFFAHADNTGFDPRSILLRARSLAAQPVATVPLSAAFSGQVIDRRQQAMGLLLFEEPIPVTEPFIVEYRDARNEEWERRLPRLDRERTRILARLGAEGTPGVE